MDENNGIENSDEITELLLNWRKGDKESLSKLISLVYDQLHYLARLALQRQPQQTLQPTALVNEAFIRFININSIDWKSRAHFFAVAANIMRNVLTDYARRHYAEKRGNGEMLLYLDEAIRWPDKAEVGLQALNDALNRLEKIDQRQSRIVEMRFFGGLTIEEIADYLEISTASVSREWRSARAWLFKEISNNLNKL